MRRTRNSVGHTLVEVAVAVTILTALLLVFGELVSVTAQAHGMVVTRDATTRTTQRLLRELHGAAFSTLRVLGDDAEGNSLFACLELNGMTPVAHTRLPVFSPDGGLGADPSGVDLTGNALLLVTEDRPLDVAVGGTTYRVDVVRFCAFYLTARTERVTLAIDHKLDLARFTSVRYADVRSLNVIASSTDRATVGLALRDAGITRAWVPEEAAATAFHDIDGTGALEASPVSSPVIEAALDEPLRALLLGERVTVLENDTSRRVPLLAHADGAFPCGFEAKVVGPWRPRRMLVRLVLAAGSPSSPVGLDVVTDVSKILTIGAR